jgi:hypothetical protein
MAKEPFDTPTSRIELPTPLKLARSGYVAYAQEDVPGHPWPTYPGQGRTPTEAIRNSCYWEKQIPFVKVVPRTRAPWWAIYALARMPGGWPKSCTECGGEIHVEADEILDVHTKAHLCMSCAGGPARGLREPALPFEDKRPYRAAGLPHGNRG